MQSTIIAAVLCQDYGSDVLPAVARAVDLAGGFDDLIPAGGTVLVKPNLLSPRAPEEAVTTHPEIVAAVARLAQQAGAGKVWIGDSCAGDHADKILWAKTGMQAVAAATGTQMVSFAGEVVPRQVGGGQVPVPLWLDDVDAVISVPKLKTHTLTGLTCAMSLSLFAQKS